MAGVYPPAAEWREYPPELAEDERFLATVRQLHEEIDRLYFADDPMANRRLGVRIRAFRRLEDWRLLLVLTPWMLSRLLVPDCVPPIRIPADWRADARRNSPYQLLGPRVTVDILGQSQQLHLNYHSALGHYLLQPIALNMEAYDSPEAVFDAWDQVIRTRDENMEKHRKDCPWQKEVSRRELFTRLRGKVED